MNDIKQIQKAGDGSQQVQAGICVVNNGISEERVRAIFAEQNQLARREYTEDAYRIADERIGKFEEQFMDRIAKVENVMPVFAEPSFQIMLREAQISAAATDQDSDYEVLSELLAFHAEKRDDRRRRSGVRRAISIVNEIDNSALCALTTAFVATNYYPNTPNISESLAMMNSLLEKAMFTDLPGDFQWVDHLETLGAIRIGSIGHLKKTIEIMSFSCPGMICVGIKKNTEDYEEAQRLLITNGINPNLLVDHECHEGYVRLSLVRPENIETLGYDFGGHRVSFSNNQKEAVRAVWDMYSQNGSQMEQVKNNYLEMWDSFHFLHQFRLWWERQPEVFNITEVGRILANTNAKRCDDRIPDLT